MSKRKPVASAEAAEAFSQSAMRYSDQAAANVLAQQQDYHLQRMAGHKALLEQQSAESLARLQTLLASFERLRSTRPE